LLLGCFAGFRAWDPDYYNYQQIYKDIGNGYVEFSDLGFSYLCVLLNWISANPILLFIVVVGLFNLVYKGIQGIKGIKYPHSFIMSITNASICIFVLMFSTFITLDTYLSYHITEYSRLLNILKFGNFKVPLYFVLFTFVVGIAVSVVGRLCRWRKKPE
jgi:hypothetical protein